MTHSFEKVGIIGGSGWLGSIIGECLLKSQFIKDHQLWISNRSEKSTDAFKNWAGVHFTKDNQQLASECDLIILSVRPKDFPYLNIHCEAKQCVISVMAGVPIHQIQKVTAANEIIRSMPNVAAEYQLSYTPWVCHGKISPEKKRSIKQLFQTLGMEEEFNSEKEIDFLTALTGSSQGWIAFLEQCFTKAALAHGLNKTQAERAIKQCFLGMATNLAHHKKPLDELIAELIAYAGTTAAGLMQFRSSNIAKEISEALDASHRKAKSDMTK